MPIGTSFVAAAGKAGRAAALMLLVLFAGCATDRPGAGLGLQVRQGGPVAPQPPKDALPFEEAVARMTDALLGRAEIDPPAAGQRLTLVVDPLIDRATGDESVATRFMERRIATVVRERHPAYELRAFDAASIAERPLVLLGAITGVAAPGVVPGLVGGQPGAYRIWAVLADLRTGTVVSHETAWVRTGEVDPTPTAFFRESPGWLPDGTTAAYLRTCAKDAGEPVDPDYLRSIQAAAAVADGIRAYEGRRYREALASYERAADAPSGDQLRVRNGIYLANLALGRQREAEAAFGELVTYGLSRGQLSVKLLFRPGSTAFWQDRATRVYPMWVRQIAHRAAGMNTCVRTIGHASTTGTAAVNDSLSLARARAVRLQLVRNAPPLEPRTDSEGRGSREPVVGTGRDDASDALDRRVEFRPFGCAAASGGTASARPEGGRPAEGPRG